eukprot:4157521-Lingulodinium_polyedra.AAC.1
MAESLVAVRLQSTVHKEPRGPRERAYEKVLGECIKQGKFGLVWRAQPADLDGRPAIVVIKRVAHRE